MNESHREHPSQRVVMTACCQCGASVPCSEEAARHSLLCGACAAMKMCSAAGIAIAAAFKSGLRREGTFELRRDDEQLGLVKAAVNDYEAMRVEWLDRHGWDDPKAEIELVTRCASSYGLTVEAVDGAIANLYPSLKDRLTPPSVVERLKGSRSHLAYPSGPWTIVYRPRYDASDAEPSYQSEYLILARGKQIAIVPATYARDLVAETTATAIASVPDFVELLVRSRSLIKKLAVDHPDETLASAVTLGRIDQALARVGVSAMDGGAS